MPNRKKRIDLLLVEMCLARSRQHAQALIMAGQVLVDDKPVTKAGSKVEAEAAIRIRGDASPYVSRGGLKLHAALEAFGLDVTGLSCLDVGASSGGFTDCLLQNGARRVVAVDVGYGQLAWQLRQDQRVTVIERTNIRKLPADALPYPIDLITIDVSFISLKIVIPAVIKFVMPQTQMIALIKPQFEVGKGLVGKGGVVRDRTLHEQVISDLMAFFEEIGFTGPPVISSPILGPKGNREFLAHLKAAD
jgi:23S rRNA (cytidine1920-2'-O)/16S rRNA (cytidine1409-2'-O)-methyltransferase